MRTNRQCVVCILNQLLRVSDYLGLDEEKKDVILRKALQKAGGIPFGEITSPEFSEQLYRVVTEVSGEPDPYRSLRREQNDLVMDRIDGFRERIRRSTDPLFTAGYYALLGNIIDYGGVRIFDTAEIFKQCDTIDITVNDYPRFRERLAAAGRILILADNAGEAVFDLLFIEEIKRFKPGLPIFYGVRSQPAINDIIREDAEYIGIHRAAQVVETGASCAGTIVAKGTDEFKEIYYRSDLIISKGQGNFETLEGEPEDILYIFKVKCGVVSDYIGLPLDSLVFAFKTRLRPGKKRGVTRNA
ncbi:MAG: DUF89 family protein [bacterium]|nr:DUF89 family protein [bacterium]